MTMSDNDNSDTEQQLCDNCDAEITLDGRRGTKIASLRGGTCMDCYKDTDSEQ